MAKFTCNFISYTLKRAVDITVILPSVTIPESMGMGGGSAPCHIPKAPYPVLYLLHGMGNNHATWTGYTNVELYAEERNIAVVNLSAENKSYVQVGGDDFFTFVSKELPEFVGAMFPISKRPEDTYIAGLSMGGFGTLVHALNFPERFAAFGAFSAAVRLNPEQLLGGDPAQATKSPGNPKYDPLTVAKQAAEAGKPLPKAYVACGEKDFLYQANEEFRDALIELGYTVTWESHPDYGHEWRFWDKQIEAFLDWLPRTDEYAGGKRQI